MSLLLAAAPPWVGQTPPPFFFLVPLLWLLVIGAIAFTVVRRRRRWLEAYGPMGAGGRSAEATLAERFARGDIEEVEYRARLEVLRASRPMLP